MTSEVDGPFGAVRCRDATRDDMAVLTHWDTMPHVIAATTDDPDGQTAFDDGDWSESFDFAEQHGPEVWRLVIAEIDGRPVGFIQIIDPHREPTGYWGDVGPGLRAIDIWIGAVDDLGHGYGTQMMTWAIETCFASPDVVGILIDPLASNVRAHRFYERLGFELVGPRTFDGDRCLVYRLDRPVT